MWGNGGWRCIEHTAPQRDGRTQISRIWGGEMEEVVRHYSCTLWSVGSIVMSSSRQTLKDTLQWGKVRAIHFTGILLARVLHTLYHNCLGSGFHFEFFRCLSIPINTFCVFIVYFEAKGQEAGAITALKNAAFEVDEKVRAGSKLRAERCSFDRLNFNVLLPFHKPTALRFILSSKKYTSP